MGLGQVAGDQVDGGLVGGDVAQGQAFAHKAAGGGGVGEQLTAPVVAQGIAELVLQAGGHGSGLLAELDGGQGGHACQHAVHGLGDDLFADDVAHGGVGLLGANFPCLNTA